MWKLIPALMSLLLAGACSGDDDSGDDTTTGGTSGSGGTGPAGSSNGGTSGSAAGSATTGGTAGSAGSSAGSSGGGKGGNAGSSSGGGNAGSSSGGKGGNAGSSGGSGGSVLRGAVSLNVLASSTCSLPAEYIDLPNVAGGHPVTATTMGEALENGGTTAEGNRVTLSCMWAEFDSGLFLDATINIQMGASRTSVNLGSTALVEGEPGEGGLFASGPILSEQYKAPTDSCTFTAIDIDPTTRSVWGEIKCPTFESQESDDVCEIGPSYFFFENCP